MNSKKHSIAKQGSTVFLRLVVVGMGAVALLLGYLILPSIHSGWAHAYPEVADWKYPFITLLVATTVPFFVALYHTLRLLQFVDRNEAFSELSVTALKYIKYCAVTFSGLYAACLPFVYYVGDKQDAPGLIVIGMVMTFAPMVIGVFVAVLQRLLQSAIDIKSENDLTV